MPKQTIDGVRLASLSLERCDKGSAAIEIKGGRYDLVTGTGFTLAKQTIGTYNDVKFTPGHATQLKINELFAAIQADLDAQLGFA